MTPHSSLLAAVARPIFWLLLSAALWVLLRGHNAPGGGFIGGLIAVAGSSLVAIVLGAPAARRLQPLDALPLALLGVGLTLASGLPALFLDLPYLTQLWSSVGISTVLLFDLGVFFSVWGALTGYVYALVDDPEPAP